MGVFTTDTDKLKGWSSNVKGFYPFYLSIFKYTHIPNLFCVLLLFAFHNFVKKFRQKGRNLDKLCVIIYV